MNFQKPSWLIAIGVIALVAFELGFKPLRMTKREAADVITPLRLETEKPLLAAGQRQGDVDKHLREVWDKATEAPEGCKDVAIEGDRLVRFDVIALNQAEFEEYAGKVVQALGTEYGKVSRLEQPNKGEEYAAKAGPFALYWPPRPQVSLGLDLRGGSRLVLQMMPTTMWSFTNKETPFFPVDDPGAKGRFVEEMRKGLEERGFKQVEVEAPNESRLTVTLATPSKEEVTRAESVMTELLTSRFPGTEKATPVSVTIDQRTADGVIGVIENRVNGMGVAEAAVQKQGMDRVIVSLPGQQDPGQITKILGTLAKLEFRHIPKKYELEEVGEGALEFRNKDTKELVNQEEVLASSDYILGGRDLRNNAAVGPGQGAGWVVHFQFKAGEPARTFSNFTRKHINEYLAIVLDGKVVSCPRIKSHIPDAGVIEGLGSLDQAKNLTNWLNAGALPVPLEVAERRTVSATLGSDTVRKSLSAGLWGAVAVVLFILLYYRFCGLLADVALGIYCLLVLAIMVELPVVLTLPGIAGLLLSVGMAVDANVIIFERLKEELRAGRTAEAAIEAGFKRAWTAILDCNLTTLIACFALYAFGTGAVKGFALTLSIGVICSFFTAVTVTKAFVLWATRNRRLATSPLFTRR